MKIIVNSTLSVWVILLILSCSSDDILPSTDNGRTEYVYELEVSGGLTDYGQSTRGATKTWSDGDVLYLRLKSNSSKIQGTANYDGESWILHVGQSLSGSGTCTAVEIENAAGSATGTSVPMNAMSAVYEDRNGAWSKSGSKVSVSLNLSPTLGRVKFKGEEGREINVGGLTTYTSYNIQNGTFTTSTSPISATILQSGFTPYIYGTLNNSTNPALTVDGQKMDYVDGMMGAGKSGWLNCPDVQDYKNKVFTVNSVTFTMVAVEGGTFTMGATSEQTDYYSNELPTHSVTLSSYMIGETEVTQELWQAVMGYKPTSGGSQWSSSYGLGAQYPAYYISWNDVQEFITKLNGITGETFRMPTEAEWEYAARGGNKSKGYLYSGSNTIGNVAWYTVNSFDKGSSSSDYGTHQVKTKSPNELGIYDMSGNVFEWCSDWYGSYSSSAQTNPTGPSSGSYRVNRGGGWNSYATYCRVAYRGYDTPSYRYISIGGFRLAL